MASGSPGDDYLSAEEVARVVGFSPGTIRRWAREARIPSVLVGGRRWFRRADVDAMTHRINNHS